VVTFQLGNYFQPIQNSEEPEKIYVEPAACSPYKINFTSIAIYGSDVASVSKSVNKNRFSFRKLISQACSLDIFL
jgi:hypothetical protein